MHDEFDRLVVRRLKRQALRLRAYRLVEGVSVVAVILLAALALQLLLDWSLRLQWDKRVAVLAAIVIVAVLTVWRYVVRPLRLRFGTEEIASAMERRFPTLNALLISAVQFDSGQVGDPASNSPELATSVVHQAAEASRNVRFGDLVNAWPARRASFVCVGVLAVVAGALMTMPQVMGIWFDRNILLADVSWPKRTQIVVEADDNGVIEGAIGDDLEIRAHIADGYQIPRQVEIIYETASGKPGRETMTGVGDRGFRMRFPRVREEMRFMLTGGDDETDWYQVHLSERPRVESARLTMTPPAYTMQDTAVLPPDQRAVELLRGGELTIHITCNKPVVKAVLMNGAERVVDAQPDGDGLQARVAPTESQTYHFDLMDDGGLRNRRPVRFSVRLIDDKPPKVRLRLPNVGNMVTPKAVLPLQAEFSDDIALAEAQLMYQVAGGGNAAQSIPVTGFQPRQRNFELHQDWPLASIEAKIGDQVSVFGRATDYDNISGPNVGESSSITFRIVTDEELLTDFNRREQEYRRQFERVAESQERLRSDLLTVLGHMNEPDVHKELDLRLAPLERRQRQITSQVNIIRQQFEQVLTELHINRLDTPETRQRLGEGIIEPLTELGTRELSEAADGLRQLGREKSLEVARTVDPLQARIGDDMQKVLDSMLKWEGFQETVTMLREILRLERELHAETQEEIERQAKDIFED